MCTDDWEWERQRWKKNEKTNEVNDVLLNNSNVESPMTVTLFTFQAEHEKAKENHEKNEKKKKIINKHRKLFDEFNEL